MPLSVIFLLAYLIMLSLIGSFLMSHSGMELRETVGSRSRVSGGISMNPSCSLRSTLGFCCPESGGCCSSYKTFSQHEIQSLSLIPPTCGCNCGFGEKKRERDSKANSMRLLSDCNRSLSPLFHLCLFSAVTTMHLSYCLSCQSSVFLSSPQTTHTNTAGGSWIAAAVFGDLYVEFCC